MIVALRETQKQQLLHRSDPRRMRRQHNALQADASLQRGCICYQRVTELPVTPTLPGPGEIALHLQPVDESQSKHSRYDDLLRIIGPESGLSSSGR